MTNIDFKRRNASIVARYQAGETMTGIGADLGLTRERVRQILQKNGVASREALNRKKTQGAINEGLDPEAYAKQAGISPAAAFWRMHKIDPEYAKLCAQRKREDRIAALIDEYKPLLERVRRGDSFTSVAGGDRALLMRLQRVAKRVGVESRHNTRWSDLSHRIPIIRDGLKRGLTWAEIARLISEQEYRPIDGLRARVYAVNHGLVTSKPRASA